MKIEKLTTLVAIEKTWDTLITDYFQSCTFLNHLERYNFCSQRYYVFSENNIPIAGAIVYTLKVNILTFSKRNFYLTMNVIGVPTSVDSSGLIGNQKYYEALVTHILKQEKGLVLGLNYENLLNINSVVQLNALPTIVFANRFDSFENYLDSMRHHYRRRAKKAIKQFIDVKVVHGSCSLFTDDHYGLYLNIMSKTPTKLEVLTKSFFTNLLDNFILTSYYHQNELLTWHITCKSDQVYSFLFGGIHYELRDQFDSYYNNVLGIIKEGIEGGYKTINLGQTAEVPKMRVGGLVVSKKMFIFHKNWLLRNIFKLFKKQLEYKTNNEVLNVFKQK